MHGQNVIIRQSQQAPSRSHDYPSVQEIQRCVNNAVHAQEPYYVTEVNIFPSYINSSQ